MTPGRSYDVQIRGTRKNKGKKATTYTNRWMVNGKYFVKTFKTAKLADTQRSQLVAAARDGQPFDLATGLPVVPSRGVEISWLEHAVDFAQMKWPESSPRYRHSLADSLSIITVQLSRGTKPASDGELRATLRRVFGNPTPDDTDEQVPHLRWLLRHSASLLDLTDKAQLRDLLEVISLKQDGTPGSQATVTRRRSALHNCLEYAVEIDRLQANPLRQIRKKRQPPSSAIDRRRVANPHQARDLIATVREQKPELEAFFALMYFAAPRPSEVLALRRSDLYLPDEGWGRIDFHRSHQSVGTQWTDDGSLTDERQLKHRAVGDLRHVPAHPELVQILRRHLDTYRCGRDGHLFVTRVGPGGIPLPGPYDQPVSLKTVYRTWQAARRTALTEDEYDSLLARRPYDLRHAAVSTWLNSGVPPALVAEWAGHSIAVLLSVYAKCIDGEEAAALRKIEATHALDFTSHRAPIAGIDPDPKIDPKIDPSHPGRADSGRRPPDTPTSGSGHTPGW